MAWLVSRGTAFVVRYLDPATGKRRQLSAGGDPTIAEARRAQVERELERKPARPARGTPTESLDRWLDALIARGRSIETKRGYGAQLRRLVAAVGASSWSAWTAPAVGRFVDGLTCSGTTKRKALTSVGTWLKWCARERLPLPPTLREDLRLLDKPSARVSAMATLTDQQLRSLLDAARETPLDIPVALGAYAGLSVGDIVSLRWDEVDLEARTLTRVLGRRKTGERLDVPMAPPLVEALRRGRQAGPLVSPVVHTAQLRRGLRALFDAAAVPWVHKDGWRLVRRSFGTHLGAMGVPLAVIASLMGHAPGSPMTLRYLRPLADQAEAAVKALGERFTVKPAAAKKARAKGA